MKQGDRLATLFVLVCVYNNLLFDIELISQTSVHRPLLIVPYLMTTLRTVVPASDVTLTI